MEMEVSWHLQLFSIQCLLLNWQIDLFWGKWRLGEILVEKCDEICVDHQNNIKSEILKNSTPFCNIICWFF